MPQIDTSRYAAVEQQKIVLAGEEHEYRYVRLHEEPMPMSEVLSWLIEQGFVRREKVVCERCGGREYPPTRNARCIADGHDFPDGWEGEDRLVGWGSTYYAVPWEKSVAR